MPFFRVGVTVAVTLGVTKCGRKTDETTPYWHFSDAETPPLWHFFEVFIYPLWHFFEANFCL